MEIEAYFNTMLLEKNGDSHLFKNRKELEKFVYNVCAGTENLLIYYAVQNGWETYDEIPRTLTFKELLESQLGNPMVEQRLKWTTEFIKMIFDKGYMDYDVATFRMKNILITK